MKIESHAPGTFCWFELGTTDAAAAKAFYGGLFGWTAKDMPAGPEMTYSMMQLGGDVAGLYAMEGSPPRWLSYIAVADADATAETIVAHRGTLLKAPFDVLEVGRMAVATDPGGAVFAIWEARRHRGASVMREAGAPTWTELRAANVDQAAAFYVATFGWKTKAVDMGPAGTYTLVAAADGQPNFGGVTTPPPSMEDSPSLWLVHFQVDDVDASTKKVGDLGGAVVMPPTAIPDIGKLAIVRDPQGATFALYEHGH